jgi:SNF2 family DNA or RNA helicase
MPTTLPTPATQRSTTISVTKNLQLNIKTPYDPALIQILRTIPGRKWLPQERVWSIPLTNLNALTERFIQQGIWSTSDVDALKLSIEKILNHSNEDVSWTKQKAKLPYRKYQLETIKFFKHRGSALGALPFAAGKTPISIAYIGELIHDGTIKKALVLGPKAVLWHWSRQTEKFFGRGLRTTIIGQGVGPKGRIKNLNRDERFEQWKREDIDIFIATYDIIRRDFMDESVDASNNKVTNPTAAFTGHWDGTVPYIIVADEVTKIKSHRSERTRFLKHLPALYRVGLSGRPLENNLEELYTIMDWVWPGCLGSFNQFKGEYLITDTWGTVKAYKNASGFRDKLKWIMIRYTSDEIDVELPPITHNTYDVILSDEEEKEYERIRAEAMNEFDIMEAMKQDPNAEHRGHMTSLLAWLTLSRMYCDHPLLVKHSDSESAKLVNVQCTKSTKLEDLLLILDELEGEKVVIFSQFRGMISIIEHAIQTRYPGKKVYKLVGGMKAQDIQKQIDDFSNDPNGGYFLSTDAGAYGVELHAAHNLINYDQHWNPAVMDQRWGRLRRPGQVNPIVVVNLSVPDQDKIEARVKEVLNQKRELYSDVIEKLATAGVAQSNEKG